MTLGRAGGLIAGYALGVVIGGPVVVLAAVRLPHKTTLLGLLVLFIAGNALAAVAPTYSVLVVGRVLSALCHGAFFGVASVVAGTLVAVVARQHHLRKIAGHGSLSTTQRYLHPDQQSITDAAALLSGHLRRSQRVPDCEHCRSCTAPYPCTTKAR